MMVSVPRPHRCMNCAYGKILVECLAIDFYVTECTSKDENAKRTESCAMETSCSCWTLKNEEILREELIELRKERENHD